MTIQNKKYFCYEIYKNLAIRSHNGTLGYSPCSFFNGSIKTNDKFDLSSIWNSKEHHELKHCVENDIYIPGCESCYTAEKNGLTSRRQGSRVLYEQFHQDTDLAQSGPTGIDYSVGNLCNLKCVICGPENSSKWLPDYEKMYPLRNIQNLKYNKFNQIELEDDQTFKNVISVHFHGGGEPLLSDSHLRLLKHIKKIKGLADVRIFYNTNATQRVSDEILEIWSECRLVELYFSIDDIDQRFDYQRTGATWTQVLETLNWYQQHMPHNHMFNINCVWSYLNLYYLDEIVDWAERNFATNRYGDPTNLIFQKAIGVNAINYCSKKTYDILCNKFEKYSQLLELVHTLEIREDLHEKFWSFITQLDKIRQTDFCAVCPEWSTLIK